MASTELAALREGLAIPACPLALDASRQWDERRQRALIRYYAAAGAGGLAVGVHTTQFAIRRPEFGLFEPVLALASEELDRADQDRAKHMTRIGGICGGTPQAVREAATLRQHGYHAGLLSLAAMPLATDDELIGHCRAVGEVIPVIGFYLQPAAGGRVLSHAFWRRFSEIPSVVAIKVAPFDRYRTLDVLRAVAESGRDDIALYTGNDDHIILDLLTTHRIAIGSDPVELRFVGGLLGQWAVWTQKAVKLHSECRTAPPSGDLLRTAVELTDANAAIFDAAHSFAGCIPGIHEILRRQGLLEGTWCLDPNETLSPGQADEIERICRAYPHLQDDTFVAEHLDVWLRG